MATATKTANTLDSAQRAWLKKVGAALDVKVATGAPGSTGVGSAAPADAKQEAKVASGAPGSTSVGSASPADAKQQTAAKDAAPAGPKISVAGKPLLIKGAKGNDVKDLQTLLNKHGATLNIDSDFGKLTDEAVREFQKKNPPLTVDGKVGEKTWAALDKDPAPPSPPSPPDTKPRRVVVIVTDAATNNAVDKAEVAIENQSEKTGNTGQATLSLAPGKHNFGVKAPGFKLKTGTVDVTDKEETQLRVELEKAATQSITIKPLDPPPLAAKVTQQFTATDDAGADVTSQVIWSSSDPNIVTIDARGLATAKDASGTATITATIAPPVGGASKDSVAAPAPIAASTILKVAGVVKGKKLVKITVSPSGSRMMRHVKQKFSATGLFIDGSDGSPVVDSLVVEWESSKPKFLEIDKKTGVAVANHATTLEITAKDPATGIVSDPVKVTVVDLESIDIVPGKPPSLPAHLQIDFRAVAKFTDGSTDPFAAAWESSADHIVSIDDQTGRATGKSPGTATIKANAGKVNPAMHAEVTVTVTDSLPPRGILRDLTELRRDLQRAEPFLARASETERAMNSAAELEQVNLEDPKSAVASRPPSKLSDQDKTNLHTSFAQVDQARVQKGRILHEMQATTRELKTVTKLQLSLKRPPDQPLKQEHKNDISTGLKMINIVLDGVVNIVPLFLEDHFKLGELVKEVITSDLVKERITAIDDELERVKKEVEELRGKLEATITKLETTITALQDAAADQIRDLSERWRVENDDFIQQTKVYRNALNDYFKLVLKASPKGDSGPGFKKTFASILTASQASLSARSALNTARLQPKGAQAFLTELQNRGKHVQDQKLPDIAIYDNGGPEFILFLGESKASVEDLVEQVQKVNKLYQSSERIDRIFKAWKDALEE